MSKVWWGLKYLEHFFKASFFNKKNSDFIEKLKEEVIFNDQHFYFFDEINAYRQELKSDKRKIEGLDLGAGSLVQTAKEKEVRTFAKNSGSPLAIGEILYKLTIYKKAETIFDLGTCLGFSALYLSKGFSKSYVRTFEGNEGLQKIAEEAFSRFNSNVKTVAGNIDETLPNELAKVDNVDIAFIDANHRYEPTVRYFHQFLEKVHQDSVLIFDDIYWSKEMNKAWNEIKSHPKVSHSIDLHKVGMVFFQNKYKTKEDLHLFLKEIYFQN
ncbi:O-methyltransferase [Sediminitomix flava]|uniref:Methyltransferase family protein n=1 Tax=Sediminitomix flava TaxID=379075 RepID=A0A315ZDJ1_SEDFL|nr:class I SAM-dependent methyltransferase [Sediminitomix flava]PWJ43695.1 methyltransferase family protein [Sediminitomix flava]